MSNSPQLIDPRIVKKITLPSFEGSEVQVWDQLLTADLMQINSEADNEIDRGVSSIKAIIKDWNFVDENGKKLEVSIDNIKKLPSKDFTVLANVIADNTDKKKL